MTRPWRRSFVMFLIAGMISCGVAVSAAPQPSLGQLAPRQVVSGFQAQSVYLNARGQAMGAHWRHQRTGLNLHVLVFESAPQFLLWVNTPPTSQKGEAHINEHLMLGKGNVGRDFMNACEMSLVVTQAATYQWFTDYHCNVVTGDEAFYDMVWQHLNALLHPNYSDDEVRREVCHLGVTSDDSTAPLRLAEKGTIYEEMVNYDAQPYRVYRFMSEAVYGQGHPMAGESGGLPADLRAVTPADVRAFHDRYYTLANMNLIVALHPGQALSEALARLDAIATRLQPSGGPGRVYDQASLPPPRPAPVGKIQVVEYPHDNEQQPGPVLFSWLGPAQLAPREQILFEIFADTLADGETSNLYKRFVDTSTRVVDCGATSVWDAVNRDQGHPLSIGLEGVEPQFMTPAKIDQLRAVIMQELKHLAALPAGAPELKQFNQRARLRLVQRQRKLSKQLNSPPMFGFRDQDETVWLWHLLLLEGTAGFRKPLNLRPELAFVERTLAAPGNPWAGYLKRWKVLGVAPYAAAARANPQLIKTEKTAEAARLQAATEQVQRQYGLSDQQEALRRFKQEYDATTARMEQVAGQSKMPPLPVQPPMTQDDPLKVKATLAREAIPVIRSTFESTTSATVGLALSVTGVPVEQMVYLALLPELLTRVGVVDRGQAVPYDEMQERQRREILGLQARFDSNYYSGRCELLLSGSGNDAGESQRAVKWLRLVLEHPDWSVTNLPRLRDVVDEVLSDQRQSIQGYPEGWVGDVRVGVRGQDRPVFMATGSLLTRTHLALRLRWLLKDVPPAPDSAALAAFVEQLSHAARGASREDLKALLAALQDSAAKPESVPEGLRSLHRAWRELGKQPRALVGEMAGDLDLTLSDTPDANLEQDWAYLCRELLRDLQTPPADTLGALQKLRTAILATGGARAYVVGSSSSQKALERPLAGLLGGLRQSAQVAPAPRVASVLLSRIRDREPQASAPVFVGCVVPVMPGAVVMNDAPAASLWDRDPDKLARMLSINLLAGGGAHTLYARTWGAGLAYSSGTGARPDVGRYSYYADQVPDLAHLMTFLSGELHRVKRDPRLVDYAAVGAFWSRAADSYETRGEQMAADIADGVTPKLVRGFREAVLALRQQPGLADRLYDYLLPEHARLLPGKDGQMSNEGGGQFLVIGPEAVLAGYETYLKSVQGPNTRLVRLYPRDFWLRGPGQE